MINILLVDDQTLMRDGLRTLLELEDDLQVIAEAGNGEEAIAQYAAHQPDVVLMDVEMPTLNGVEATKQIVAADANARIIILTTFDTDTYIFEGLRNGAKGYLLKAVSGDELASAIRTVNGGNSLIDPAVTAKVLAALSGTTPAAAPAQPLIDPLSERELDVLRLLAAGNSNREIARALHLAEGTVKNYVTSLLQKIGARDRTQAALKAKELGIL